MQTDHSMCYFINALDLLWMWVFPSSTILFIGTYLLTMGESTSPDTLLRMQRRWTPAHP